MNTTNGITFLRSHNEHQDFVGRIAWSPNGRLLATPSGDNTIKIWDDETDNSQRTLIAHTDRVCCVAFNPSNGLLASGGWDEMIRIWDPMSGELLNTFKGHEHAVYSLAYNANGSLLASGGKDGLVKLWSPDSEKPKLTLSGHQGLVTSVAFSIDGKQVASGSEDCKIKFWDAASGSLLHTLAGHARAVKCVTFSPDGEHIASASDDHTIKLWSTSNWRLFLTLEGHTKVINYLTYSPDGRCIASRGDDMIRFWDSQNGRKLSRISSPTSTRWPPSIAFHPHEPIFSAVGSPLGSRPDSSASHNDESINIFEIDLDLLLADPNPRGSISYKSAKIVLVGDSGVGKTCLGWRMAHGEFKEHASTHGQQFWLLNELSKERRDGITCETILWDLAGQTDYRLIHALFLGDADLVLLLFDPTHYQNPLSGVEYWLKQIQINNTSGEGIPAILIATRSDMGGARLTKEELDSYCIKKKISSYLATSAKDEVGIKELLTQMEALMPWDAKPATVTTEAFKQIRNFVLSIKGSSSQESILTLKELQNRLSLFNKAWKFTHDEVETAVGHLATHGFVTCLRTSKNELQVLLMPELLNNLAASFILEARSDPRDLGSLSEHKLLSGGYSFKGIREMPKHEKDILIDSVVTLFLKHNICFRETGLHGETYLVFPELINLKRSTFGDEVQTEDNITYTATGAVENAYAALVVLMGYTNNFTRTDQSHNHARYEVGEGEICGFRLEQQQPGQLLFVIYFSTKTSESWRMIFQGLFEKFLLQRNLTVFRYVTVSCKNGHLINSAVVRERSSAGSSFVFCSECGQKTNLPESNKPISITDEQAAQVTLDEQAAARRSRYERLLFWLKTYLDESIKRKVTCFISYAWGNHDQERWVESRLATDLQKAGVSVILDRWENSRIGSSIPRFVELAAQSDYIVTVGSHLYLTKYDNNDPMGPFVLAAEGDIIGQRMTGSETRKESVLPLLLEGSEETSLPHLLRGRVHADFRESKDYDTSILSLLMTLFGISPQDPVVKYLNDRLIEATLNGPHQNSV